MSKVIAVLVVWMMFYLLMLIAIPTALSQPDWAYNLLGLVLAAITAICLMGPLPWSLNKVCR